MNLDKVFPYVSFTSAEMAEIATAINKPAVQKYLKHQQGEFIKGIGNGLPDEGESAESYVRRQAVVVGNLEVLEQLLGIEPATASS
jgi:hypothetical protein